MWFSNVTRSLQIRPSMPFIIQTSEGLAVGEGSLGGAGRALTVGTVVGLAVVGVDVVLVVGAKVLP